MYAEQLSDGSYVIDFIFGPSGAFFVPELKLILSDYYVENESDVGLYDEEGNPVESEFYDDGDAIIFFIEHFSEYYYPRR
jgi:hypothetical protein